MYDYKDNSDVWLERWFWCMIRKIILMYNYKDNSDVWL